jgi:hypothetical protein
MKKIAVVLNWVMLGLFGIALIGLGVQYPRAVAGSSVVLLLPYTLALLALRSRTNNFLMGCSIFSNGLMALIGVVYVLLGFGMGQGTKALLAAVILLPPLLVNCVVLKRVWGEARVAEVANSRLQATRETRAPEA